MQLSVSSPFQNFTYALKSKDVKRQYPAMLSRFLNFLDIEGETIEDKCHFFYNFAKNVDNRKALESELMRYITFQEVRIKKELFKW
ncbi:MAG TPA: hypothetical protein VIZ62_08555, partial [Nitrososphaeraceae archaeon]